jgi:hypothetical protein
VIVITVVVALRYRRVGERGPGRPGPPFLERLLVTPEHVDPAAGV